jgi:hypothetical protein
MLCVETPTERYTLNDQRSKESWEFMTPKEAKEKFRSIINNANDPRHEAVAGAELKAQHVFFSIPVTQEVLDEAVAVGMIPKKDLKDGHAYVGNCRNAAVAVWYAKDNQFVYIRSKFGAEYEEDIKHPEDDDSYDLFVPMLELPE